MKLKISGYGIRKNGQWFIGFRYLGPGKTEAVWSEEKTESIWIGKYWKDAEKMAERTGGEIEGVKLEIDV